MQPAVCSCAPAIAELCSAREAGRTQRELIHGCACWDGKDSNALEKRVQQVFSLVYFLLMKCLVKRRIVLPGEAVAKWSMVQDQQLIYGTELTTAALSF